MLTAPNGIEGASLNMTSVQIPWSLTTLRRAGSVYVGTVSPERRSPSIRYFSRTVSNNQGSKGERSAANQSLQGQERALGLQPDSPLSLLGCLPLSHQVPEASLSISKVPARLSRCQPLAMRSLHTKRAS